LTNVFAIQYQPLICLLTVDTHFAL